MSKDERKNEVRRQVQLLGKFYKKLNTGEIAIIGWWIVAGILLPLGTVFLWIPCQWYGGKDQFMYVVLLNILWLGLFMYMRPYILISQNVTVRMLQYLPVDRRSILYFQLGKLFRMVLLLGGIQIMGQCIAAVIAFGTIELRNFWFPIVFGMLLPAAVNTLLIILGIVCTRS